MAQKMAQKRNVSERLGVFHGQHRPVPRRHKAGVGDKAIAHDPERTLGTQQPQHQPRPDLVALLVGEVAAFD
jgi:hypothetical protein